MVCVVALNSRAQNAASAETPQTRVVMTKLSPPGYPALARQAHIAGEVTIQLAIRPDGSVESAMLFSGHPMLAPAALESAQKSQFECRGCGDGVTPYSLTFAFEVRDDKECCNAFSRSPDVTQSRDRITIAAPAQCLCDPTATITESNSVRRSAFICGGVGLAWSTSERAGRLPQRLKPTVNYDSYRHS